MKLTGPKRLEKNTPTQLSLVKDSNGQLKSHPPKIDMEPENELLEEEIPIKNHHFQIPC